MSLQELSEYTRFGRYAQFRKDLGRREVWEEQVDRKFGMYETYYGDILNPIRDEFERAKSLMLEKRVLGSQRALQFGGPAILDHHARMFNCSATAIDRVRAFQEIFYVLLCGAGVGFSVQRHHVNKLPDVNKVSSTTETYVVKDSIEGWADAICALMSSYFVTGYDEKFSKYNGKTVKFDYSMVRPAGSPISWGGIAPGPKGLANSIEKIRKLMNRLTESSNRIRPIVAYDIVMHVSDAVLSGGIRRAATLALFSLDDEEMAKAKIGNWMSENPQRARSNNSAALLRGEVTREEFAQLMQSTRQFGEPGFIWVPHLNVLFNPCVEVSFEPFLFNDKLEITESGFAWCNLSEINGRLATTAERFHEGCWAAAFIGTLQAGFTHFKYLTKASQLIAERDALLGVSITGVMDTPDILHDKDIVAEGAKVVNQTNTDVAKVLGINSAARTTCVKPSGTASALLGTASGIHPHHSRRYIRHVQANKLETTAQYYEQINPSAVEESVWSNNGTDVVIAFTCEVPKGAKLKNQLSAVDLLKHVRDTYLNWVVPGTVAVRGLSDKLINNVSNTITVKPDEWDAVEEFIFDNQQYLAGVSLLPFSGDKDFPQAPFTTVHTPKEIADMYGDGSMFASGLIVDGLKAYDNIWCASMCVMDTSYDPIVEYSEKVQWIKATKQLIGKKKKFASIDAAREWCLTSLHQNDGLGDWITLTQQIAQKYFRDNLVQVFSLFGRSDADLIEELGVRVDWIRRAKQFAERYFDGDVRCMTYCLKDVSLWKRWCDINREHTPVDWTQLEEEDYKVDVTTTGAAACAGGKCEI